MMTRPLRATSVALALAAVAACGGPAPRSRADLGAQSACRARADQAYERQNRDAPYRNDRYETSSLDSPFASNGTPGITTRGLADEYERQNNIQRCLSGIGQPPSTDVQVGTPQPLSPRPAPPR